MRGYNLPIIINALFNHAQMFLIMPHVRMSIFSRLFHMGYIFVASTSSRYLVKFVATLLEFKISLIRQECHICTKETWITECLFTRPRVVTPKLPTQLRSFKNFCFKEQRSVLKLHRP